MTQVASAAFLALAQRPPLSPGISASIHLHSPGRDPSVASPPAQHLQTDSGPRARSLQYEGDWGPLKEDVYSAGKLGPNGGEEV